MSDLTRYTFVKVDEKETVRHASMELLRAVAYP